VRGVLALFWRSLLIALVVLLGATQWAIASTVDTPFGPGTALKDDSTNLVWLDLTLTSNKSYDSVIANLALGGIYVGWRYATPTELVRLFADYDGGIIDDALALKFMNDLGGPLSSVFNPQNGFSRLSSIGLLDVPFGLGHATYGYIAVDNFFGPSIDPGLQGSALDSFGNSSVGSWLVQTQTPEPGFLPIIAVVVFGTMLLDLRNRCRRAD
jgi:hypothetical protein